MRRRRTRPIRRRCWWLTESPGGLIDLNWDAANLALTYQVFRAAGDCAVAPTNPVQIDVVGHVFQDIPPADGNYCYGIASERLGAVSVR